MGREVIATKLDSEFVMPLEVLRKHPDIPIKKSRATFNTWCRRGARAGNGKRIPLEAVNIDGVLHSSVPAVRRLIQLLVQNGYLDGKVIVTLRNPGKSSRKK